MRIKVENLSFAHDLSITMPGNTINNFNIEFEQGNFYSLLGPNGSGKTTFLDLLTGYLKPDSGNVLFNDNNIISFSKNQLSRKIALVSQEYSINFPYTVKEIVTMGRHPYMGRFLSLDKKDKDIVKHIASITDINDLMERTITCLSGGEKQRCVFARALCQQTPVLLLDEAFSNMDINHSFNLLKILKNMIRDNKIIVISVFHDINFASIWSDKMIFLKKGDIMAYGTPNDVMTEANIKKVYDIKAKVEHNAFAKAKQVYFSTN